MKVLIIDNNTSYLPALRRLFAEHSIEEILIGDLKSTTLPTYDVILLSGGHAHSIQYEHQLFEEEVKMLLRTNIPVIGICLGFELIISAFGGTLALLPEKERGILDMEILKDDPVFKDVRELKVFEMHRWVAKKLPEDLIPLA